MQLLKTFLMQYVSPIGLSPKKLLRKERNPDIEGKNETFSVRQTLVKTLLIKSLWASVLLFGKDNDYPWKRKWQPSPVFFPGESLGQRSLVGYSP